MFVFVFWFLVHHQPVRLHGLILNKKCELFLLVTLLIFFLFKVIITHFIHLVGILITLEDRRAYLVILKICWGLSFIWQFGDWRQSWLIRLTYFVFWKNERKIISCIDFCLIFLNQNSLFIYYRCSWYTISSYRGLMHD